MVVIDFASTHVRSAYDDQMTVYCRLPLTQISMSRQHILTRLGLSSGQERQRQKKG